MPDYMPVPVEAAANIARQYHKDVVVVLSVDGTHDKVHTTTYGAAAHLKDFAAKLGDDITQFVGCDLSLRETHQDYREPSEAALNALAARSATAILASITRGNPETEKIAAWLKEHGLRFREAM